MRCFSRNAALATCIIFTGVAPVSCKAAGPSKPAPKPKVVTKAAPPTPIQKKRLTLGGPTWNPRWGRVVEKSLPSAMLSSEAPRDIRRFCPRFFKMSKANRREFWAYFFQALAGAEAGLKPTTNVTHTAALAPDAVTGKTVHSEGLLQLAYEDAKRYGCHFDWRADRKLPPNSPRRTILNPVNNLKCGIKILYAQIIQHGKPLLTPKSYWSTLRPGTPSYSVFAKQMTNPPMVCKLPPEKLAEREQGVEFSADRKTAETAPPGRAGGLR